MSDEWRYKLEETAGWSDGWQLINFLPFPLAKLLANLMQRNFASAISPCFTTLSVQQEGNKNSVQRAAFAMCSVFIKRIYAL